MPISDAYNKTDRLQQIQLLFWQNPGRRMRTSEIADMLIISPDTVTRYLEELSVEGWLPLIKDGWYWQLAKDANFELLPMKLNLPEGTALYLAARLLTQIQDERNTFVLSALRILFNPPVGRQDVEHVQGQSTARSLTRQPGHIPILGALSWG